MDTIRNPVEWSLDQVRLGASAFASVGRALGHADQDIFAPAPAVRPIAVANLATALRRGFADFMAYRTDVVFLCVVYPVAGIILASISFKHGMLPLLFPLASGFALVGPFAGIGLYELSRRREQAVSVAPWPDAFGVVRAPAFGKIVALGVVLVAILLLWLVTAQGIYDLTLGPKPPPSAAAFLRDIFTTGAGWTLIVAGCGAGFLYAVVALMVGVVSFPLLLDRDVSLGVAVWTSIRAVAVNPLALAAWGLIVASGLVIGSIPMLLGLVIVMPVLGHATWHLYRMLVPR
ncbi:MAG TPA: DUF2189 domain-containing protein [Stellaceae bacterium]|nr:DUF2189 domain-containing protein [Stellaceae bacterium]